MWYGSGWAFGQSIGFGMDGWRDGIARTQGVRESQRRWLYEVTGGEKGKREEKKSGGQEVVINDMIDGFDDE